MEAASIQIEINKQDLENLNNILNIISVKKNSLKDNINKYNSLLSKVEKNVVLVDNILKKTINSCDQFSEISNISSLDTTKTSENTSDLDSKKNDNSIDIKQINNASSSDLLCFFPKSDKDIFAVSTLQDTYSIIFNEEQATVSIKDDNFNFTLKTIGVQISNDSNMLLISRNSKGIVIITNMEVDIPSCINVSKINRNKTFIEISIINSAITVSVNKNKMTLSECEAKSSINSATTDNSNISEPIKSNPDNELHDNVAVTDNIKNADPSHTKINLMEDNNSLIISEKDDQIILPYTMQEVEKIYKKIRKNIRLYKN